MTGWRLGYVAGPTEIIQCMITMQQYAFSSVTSFAQKRPSSPSITIWTT
jgi:aspartate/methionine/tyrosine aminotransferase